MAEPMTPKVATDPKHNSIAREACIQKWSADRLKKQREIDKAIELYVEPLKKDLARLNKNAKTDTGIALKYLHATYKLFELQENAKQFMDEDEAEDVLDDMKNAFDAMARGGQLDFVTAMEGGANQHGDEDISSPAMLRRALDAGRDAGGSGVDAAENPYDTGTDAHAKWSEGWTEAQTELAQGLSSSEGEAA